MSRADWANVSSDAPCLICGRPDWCSRSTNGVWATCYRLDRGNGRHKLDRNGTEYWLYRLDGSPLQLGANTVDPPVDDVARAEDPDLDRVYRALLDQLVLEDRHREGLLARGLDAASIESGRYRSLPLEGRKSLATALVERFGKELCRQVPGLYIKHQDDQEWWALAGAPGTVIPVLTAEGLVVSLQVRADGDGQPRYTYVSSSKHGGPGPGVRLHVPPGVAGPGEDGTVRITEGALKAHIATLKSGVPTLSLPGVSTWSLALPVLRSIGARTVLLAFDADIWTNPTVARALARSAATLKKAGFDVGIETWIADLGKGIDDVLAAGHETEIAFGADAKRLLDALGADNADNADNTLSNPRDDIGLIRDRIDHLDVSTEGDWLDILQRLEDDGLVEAIAGLPSSRHRPMAELVGRKLELGPNSTELKSLSAAVRDAHRALSSAENDQERTGGSSGKTIDLVMAIASECELLHDELREPFALVTIRNVRQVLPTHGSDYKRWLAGQLWARHRTTISDATLATALQVIDSQAVFEGVRREVHLRVCRDPDGGCWYDLANDRWEVVKVTPDGWKLVSEPPVLFRRHRKTAAQVMPERGGDLTELRQYVNFQEDRDWHLFIAWLVSALIEGSSRPIVVLNGEQGTAKSTLGRVARRLIDPALSELITAPTSVGELAQSAYHGWLLAFDNLSHIPSWLSDCLCRVSTGDAFEKRRLFTDAEDIIWCYRRVILLNGIGQVVSRPDILQRSLLITLEPFGEGERKPEEQFWAEFERARPRIVGALFDVLSRTLAALPSVEVRPDIRMADFSRIGAAVEVAMGWPTGTFEAAIQANTDAQVAESIESSPVACAVMRFMAGRDAWQGSATELRGALMKDWDGADGSAPKTPNKVGSEMRRVAPALRKRGIHVAFDRSGSRDRARQIIITVRGGPNQLSESSALSEGQSHCETTSHKLKVSQGIASTFASPAPGGQRTIFPVLDGERTTADNASGISETTADQSEAPDIEEFVL